MKDIKITIPDNCELIKKGDSYIVKKKSLQYPKTWENFCKNYPTTEKECYIDLSSEITHVNAEKRCSEYDKNICVSKEEAEAFLALMQLRQLRKAWVRDWKPSGKNYCAIVPNINGLIEIENYQLICHVLSFPTREMAEEFLKCFKDLCETAKILL